MTRTFTSVMLAVLTTCLLSGCAGIRLHSETRDKQGQDLKKGWSEVDLKGYFSSQRAERKKLVQAELDSISAHVMARREAELRIVVDHSVAAHVKRVDDAVRVRTGGAHVGTSIDDAITQAANKKVPGTGEVTLIAKPDDKAAAQSMSLDELVRRWQAASQRLSTAKKNQQINRLWLQADGVVAFACDAFTDGTLTKWKSANAANMALLDEAEPIIDDLGLWCKRDKELSQYLTALSASFGSDSELGQDWARIAELERRINTATSQAQAHVEAYKLAAKDYDEAIAKSKTGALPSSEIAKFSKRLRTALAAFSSIQDAFSREALSRERIDMLNGLLEDVEGGKNSDKDSSKTEVVALLLPTIADDAKVLSNLNKSSPKAALLIRREVERFRADAARLEIQYEQQRLNLSRKVFASRMQEAILLLKSKQALEPAKNLSGNFANAIGAASSSTQKRALYDSAARYLDAIGRQQVETRKLLHMITEATHERAINVAEINAAQWASLIDSVVGQASEFAAGGIKSGNLTDLIQSIGVLWIGRGVNK